MGVCCGGFTAALAGSFRVVGDPSPGEAASVESVVVVIVMTLWESGV
jgi:hypothetical protein